MAHKCWLLSQPEENLEGETAGRWHSRYISGGGKRLKNHRCGVDSELSTVIEGSTMVVALICGAEKFVILYKEDFGSAVVFLDLVRENVKFPETSLSHMKVSWSAFQIIAIIPESWRISSFPIVFFSSIVCFSSIVYTVRQPRFFPSFAFFFDFDFDRWEKEGHSIIGLMLAMVVEQFHSRIGGGRYEGIATLETLG